MTNLASGSDERVNQILDLIQKFSGQNFSRDAAAMDGRHELDIIIAALNDLGKGLHATTVYVDQNKKRIDNILDVLMHYTMSDFSKRSDISEAGDELDAIALGLNTLAEELEAAKLNERKYVTELEHANDELRSFSYIASHDLQEPLRNIKIFSNLLTERDADNLSDKGKQLLSKINNSTRRMQTLIDDLLAFSRTQTYKNDKVIVNLDEVLEAILSNYADARDDKRFLVDTTPLPKVYGIAFQFHQLLDNLISNAIKYSKPDSIPHIKVSLDLVEGAALVAHGADEHFKYNRIAFADNGIGFEPQYATRIFEIFQRLHGREEYSGTGIGLAICKKIVQNHQGVIYAESKPGEGSVFYVCLPV